MNAQFARGVGLTALAVALWGCDSGTTPPTGTPPPPTPPPPPPPPSSPAVTASEWIDYVNWDDATTVEVQMVETSGTEMSFSPNALSFEAGKPYILKIINPASNAFKHYFSPENSSLYQAIATRKMQTPDAEYKAPYFDAVELLPGGFVEVFMVPVLAGIYDIVCTIPGHKEFGMTATAEVTGGEGFLLDLEVASDFVEALMSDARRSGSDPVWDAAVDLTVSMFESSDAFGFVPPDIELTQGVGYKLNLDNPSGNASKHYYTAAEFYKTVVLRKAEDSNAEIKAPYLKAVELLIGGSAELFLVPTVTGEFGTICTIPGHADLGMTGTITVIP